jgi:hypothetical protein
MWLCLILRGKYVIKKIRMAGLVLTSVIAGAMMSDSYAGS